jgi:glyoxylase-like metal-dependent hydrolase (beta-lactamase superfamily II)
MHSAIKVGSYAGVKYEITEKPWFGPHSRGLKLLRESPLYGKEMFPEDFLRTLRRRHPDCYRSVEFVRFLQRDTDKGAHQRFAICYTAPHYESRTRLYDLGPELTNITGWYPLVTGRRTRLARPILKRWPTEESAAISCVANTVIEDLTSLVSAEPDARCSFILSGRQNAIALDCGSKFPFSNYKLAFGILTHTHRDHSGGLREALAGGLTIFASESTVRQLDVLCPLPFKLRRRLIPVRPSTVISTANGAKITFMPTSHTPGAVGVRVSTSGTEFVYLGDYCLNNTFFRQSLDVLERFFEKTGSKRWLLLDSTFVGHEPKRVGTIQQVSQMIARAHADAKDLLITAPSADYLYCLYIWMFRSYYSGKRSQRNLFVHSRVLRVLETALEAFIGREHKDYDPFLRSVMKKSWESPVESFRLYDFSVTSSFKKVPGPLDIFCEDQFLNAVRAERPNASVIHVGRLNGKAPDILYADGPDLSFHSSEADVMSMVRYAARRGIRPILFHNYPKRLQECTFKYGVNPRTFVVASGKLSLR